MVSGEGGPSADVLEPGTRVGDYVVDGVLGRGGFGVVYAGHHPVIDKQVAIKVLTHARDANLVSRFVDEARVVNQIRHPGIVQVIGFGELEDRIPYCVMERLEGESLQARLDRDGRIDGPETLALLGEVCDALAAAHGAGVIHRDLQPANVFLVSDSDGVRPIILDFGIAKLLSSEEAKNRTRTGEVLGTPQFMAPEQCRGREIDERTDVYAFGAMAYQMLVGAPPYEGPNSFATLMLHVSAPIPLASEHADDLPATLDGVFTRLLAKEPDDRPETIGEAYELLRGAIAIPDRPQVYGRTLVDPEVASLEARPRTGAWRYAVAAGIAAAVLVAVVAVRATSPKSEAAEPAKPKEAEKSSEPVSPAGEAQRKSPREAPPRDLDIAATKPVELEAGTVEPSDAKAERKKAKKKPKPTSKPKSMSDEDMEEPEWGD